MRLLRDFRIRGLWPSLFARQDSLIASNRQKPFPNIWNTRLIVSYGFATAGKNTLIKRRDLGACHVLENTQGRFLSVAGLESGSRCPPLDIVFIRDSCTCNKCVSENSGQKQFETAAIPLDIDVSAVERLQDGLIQISWSKDVEGYENHRTVVHSSFWESNSTERNRKVAAFEAKSVKPWNKADISAVEAHIHYSFEDYMQSDQVLRQLLHTLSDYGLAFITQVPDDPNIIVPMSQRVGPLQNTFYGETWDVRARPSAKNVAYTNESLGFHMDLLYMKDPPYLQFLHCIRQSAEGGESLFSDTLNAVYGIQQDHPSLAPLLWRFPVTYRYNTGGKYYQYIRPMIEGPGLIDADETFTKWRREMNGVGATKTLHSKAGLLWGQHFDVVNWSPPFQGPFIQDIGDGTTKAAGKSYLRDFVLTAGLFRSIIESSRNVYQTKLEAGTCVVFDNRRIVHARKAFTSAGGERWLKGSYIDSSSFKSRLRAFEAGMTDLQPSVLNEE